MEPSQVTLYCETAHSAGIIRNNLLELGYAATRHGKSVVVICYCLPQLHRDLMELGYEYEVAR